MYTMPYKNDISFTFKCNNKNGKHASHEFHFIVLVLMVYL